MRLLLGHSGDSPIHRLDPRIKLLWLLGNVVLSVTCQSAWMLTWVLASVCLATSVARISLREFLPLLKVMTVMGIQIILLQGLIRQEGPILIEFGALRVFAGGLLVGLRGVALLLIMTLLFLQFVMWTSPGELTLLLVTLGLSHRYAVLVGMALRFVPIVERDLRAILEGQQSRGLPLDSTLQIAKGLLWITVPLILRTLRRAHEVAMSMELKGFSLHHRRTYLNNLRFSQVDALALGILLAYFLPALSVTAIGSRW